VILVARQHGGHNYFATVLHVRHSEFELFEVGPSSALEGGLGVGTETGVLQTAS
jgi:hypothetical protein